MQYIQISLTIILALWNFYLQLKLKKIDFQNKQIEIKTNKIADYEYSSYKDIWQLAVVTINKARYLRAYPLKTSTELIPYEESKTFFAQKLNEYDNAINEFDNFLKSTAPFIHKDIKNIFRQIVSIGKLEFYQSFSTGNLIYAKQMDQASNNLKRMESLLDEAEDKMRKLIIGE